MKIRRVAVVGIAVFALTGTVAGCATKNGTSAAANSTRPASPSPSPTPEPENVLLASAKSLGTASYKFTVQADGLTGTGSADGANDRMHAALSGREQNVSVAMDIIVVDFDVYMKMAPGPLTNALGIPPNKYVHIDVTKLGENSTLPIFPGRGPLDVAGLMGGMVAQTTDGKSFSGTVDLTKATGDDAPPAALLGKGRRQSEVRAVHRDTRRPGADDPPQDRRIRDRPAVGLGGDLQRFRQPRGCYPAGQLAGRRSSGLRHEDVPELLKLVAPILRCLTFGRGH